MKRETHKLTADEYLQGVYTCRSIEDAKAQSMDFTIRRADMGGLEPWSYYYRGEKVNVHIMEV